MTAILLAPMRGVLRSFELSLPLGKRALNDLSLASLFFGICFTLKALSNTLVADLWFRLGATLYFLSGERDCARFKNNELLITAATPPSMID